jgi:CDP-diacylglycerol---glycerol-3-phosphate 3-phosphatidyltransferase
MKRLWEWIIRGYLRVIAPVADFLVRRRVNPNLITTVGTLCSMTGGVIYATGHIRTAGWFLGLTALFDVLDGTVARRTGQSTTFGAFYDSTLDRVADGFVLGGLTVFYATSAAHHNVPMVVVSLLGVIGTFLVSYTRARAESLGIDAKVGVMQRPERVTLLSAPQAFFGLALDGYILMAIVATLSATAWITAFQRIAFVHGETARIDAERAASAPPPAVPAAAERTIPVPTAAEGVAPSAEPAHDGAERPRPSLRSGATRAS